MPNIYKFSTRDGEKFLTKNGIELKVPEGTDWGWYGSKAIKTAFVLLENEFGTNVAKRYTAAFVRNYLAEVVRDNFGWTSQVLGNMIEDLKKPEVSE